MPDERASGASRRQFLASVAAASVTVGLAGCQTGPAPDGVGDSGATDVVAYSLASNPKTVSIRITELGAESPRTDRTLDVSPGEVVDPVNAGKLPTNTGYMVEVTVAGGPSETFEWAEPSVDLAPLWVQIDDSRNIHFLLQAG